MNPLTETKSVQNTLQRSLRPHPHEYPAKEYVVSKNLRVLVDSFAARGFGLGPTPKIPAAREKTSGTQGRAIV